MAELRSLVSQAPVAQATCPGKGCRWGLCSRSKRHLFHLGALSEAFLEEVVFQPSLEG